MEPNYPLLPKPSRIGMEERQEKLADIKMAIATLEQVRFVD